MLAQKRSRTSWVPRQRCLAAVYTAALAKGGARGGRRAGWTRRRLAYNISLKTELLLPAYISRLVPACLHFCTFFRTPSALSVDSLLPGPDDHCAACTWVPLAATLLPSSDFSSGTSALSVPPPAALVRVASPAYARRFLRCQSGDPPDSSVTDHIT